MQPRGAARAASMGGAHVRTYTIGRLADASIRVHPSLVAMALPIAFLAFGTGRRLSPHGSQGLSFSIALGLGGILIYFASQLLHELGHVLALRSYGVLAETITFDATGGRT